MAKAIFFRRKLSFRTGRCLLSTLTDKAMSNVNGSTARNVCRIVHCNGCRIACTRLTGIFIGFKRVIGTKRVITLDNSELRFRMGFSNGRVGPVSFLAVLCNGIGTVRRANGGNFPRFRACSVGVTARCSGGRGRVRRLVLHFVPSCVRSLCGNVCIAPRRTRRSLEGVFALSTTGRCFCRTVPSVDGPLNVKRETVPLTYGIRGLLVTSFLGCLTLQRNVCLSALDRILGGGSVAGPWKQITSSAHLLG